MDKEYITKKLVEWMVSFVEQSNSALGNWPPCPYARAARVNNQIEILISDVADLYFNTVDSIQHLENKEVVVICFDHHQIDAVTLQELVSGLNNKLMVDNYVVLEDHPHIPEYVSGVKMNFGECGLLVVQKLDKLNTASAQLKEKGYYHHWDKSSIDNVVSWRHHNL
jgi:hypothetical protein